MDLIAGICLNTFNINFTFSSLIRMLFLLFAIYYLWFINKERNKPYLLVLFSYASLFLLGIHLFKGKTNLYYETKMLLNILYMPINLLFVLRIYRSKKIDLKKISQVLMIYLILVFIPSLLNIGFNSYAYAKNGSVGFFYSANAIGSIISMLAPVSFAYTIVNKNKFKLFILLVMYLYTLVDLGTKAPLLCALIIIIYYAIYLIFKLLKDKKYKIFSFVILSLIVILCLVIFLIPKTPFYENILIHLKFLGINNIKDFFTFKCLDRFIFSDRLSFLKNALLEFNNSNIYQKIFGVGYTTSEGILKLAEMDFFDCLIHQGIIGFIIIYFLYFKVLFNIFKTYFKNFKHNFFNITKSSSFIAILISILCAFLTGHVLSTPAVAIYVIIVLVIANQKVKEE